MVVPEGVEMIEPGAFQDCIHLKAVFLPDSLREIGYGAFWGCTALEEVELPRQLAILERYAFYNCTSLASIDIPGRVEYVRQNFRSRAPAEGRKKRALGPAGVPKEKRPKETGESGPTAEDSPAADGDQSRRVFRVPADRSPHSPGDNGDW